MSLFVGLFLFCASLLDCAASSWMSFHACILCCCVYMCTWTNNLVWYKSVCLLACNSSFISPLYISNIITIVVIVVILTSLTPQQQQQHRTSHSHTRMFCSLSRRHEHVPSESSMCRRELREFVRVLVARKCVAQGVWNYVMRWVNVYDKSERDECKAQVTTKLPLKFRCLEQRRNWWSFFLFNQIHKQILILSDGLLYFIFVVVSSLWIALKLNAKNPRWKSS